MTTFRNSPECLGILNFRMDLLIHNKPTNRYNDKLYFLNQALAMLGTDGFTTIRTVTEYGLERVMGIGQDPEPLNEAGIVKGSGTFGIFTHAVRCNTRIQRRRRRHLVTITNTTFVLKIRQAVSGTGAGFGKREVKHVFQMKSH